MIDISSLVLFATDLDASTRFYRTVGVPLEDEEHDDGPVHVACEIGPVHVAVYQAEETPTVAAGPWRSAGSVFAGFYVDSLDATTAALTELGAPLLEQHQVRPWGCRIVASDPDGRAVEINQKGHCP